VVESARLPYRRRMATGALRVTRCRYVIGFRRTSRPSVGVGRVAMAVGTGRRPGMVHGGW
jgi:hypothetical protein